MRGVRQRRPSEKVNEHKDTRSFGLREDIKVSLELSFGIAYGEEPAGHPCRQTDGTKQKRPGLAGAQLSTRILYHNGSAGQAKKLGAKERKVKTRSLKTEGCGTPRVSAPPAGQGESTRWRDSCRVCAHPARTPVFHFLTRFWITSELPTIRKLCVFARIEMPLGTKRARTPITQALALLLEMP